MVFFQKKSAALFFFALGALLTLILAVNACAQEPNIHIGALEIHPYGSVKQTYDSNIFLEPKNRENGDMITDT
ncbi:MAG: hypothetical protein ABIJ27_06845, partial [Candidatus Omnitrophota bacterium]